MPRRRAVQAAPAESWRSAIAAYAWTLIAAIAWIIVLLAMTSVDQVDARSPDDRCDACRLVTPRPGPTVVGLPPRPGPTVVGLPSPTLPSTDSR